MVPREVLIRGLATALKVGAVAAAVALSRIPRWQTVVFILSLFPFITAGAFYRFLPRELFSGPPLAGGERRDVIRFSLTFGAGGALWLGAVLSPVLIVFALAGETQAAHYYLSNQLVMPALILLSQYMSVMSARTSRAASAAEARSLQKRSLPYLAGFVFVLAVVFIASRPLMALVWSEKYRESAPTFQALLTAMAIQVIQVPVEMLITYHKRGGILLAMNGICAGSTVFFSVLLAPTHGAEGCALAFAGSLAVSRVIGLAILVRSGLLPPRSRATR
jgi:O-antigen/teichoic acid export membrane protein